MSRNHSVLNPIKMAIPALSLWLGVSSLLRAGTAPLADPLFDLEAIMTEPVDYETLETEVVDGITFEHFEFTSRIANGTPERIRGIYAYPNVGEALPAVYWCQGGMAAANRGFPGIFARKGYACLAITLPHNLRNSFRLAFDAANPATANMTLLARDQLRGMTVLSQRPQVDPDRMAVAGASYGGLFATLIAGVDPRVKAGFSFFAGGNHALGTNLPQFLRMTSLEDVEVWNQTFDPAFRLKTRALPFMWGVAFNDNWFDFPAVARTFLDAAGDDKRIAIVPHWEHGFPPHIDQTLIDFLDTTLMKTRLPYNAPGPLELYPSEGETLAEFTWTGDNPVKQAELVVSYGEPVGWLGWRGRAAFVFPAIIEQGRARARLPIPSRNLPLIAWGSITDENDVLTSTPPLTLTRDRLALLPINDRLTLNAFIDGDLGADVLDLYARHNQPLGGEPDRDVKQAGDQSLRFSSATAVNQTAGLSIQRFQHVPGVAHKLDVWVRADAAVTLTVTLTPVRPSSWRSELLRQLVAGEPSLAPMIPLWDTPSAPLSATAVAGPEWRQIALDVPKPEGPVERYRLEVQPAEATTATWWIDSIRMQPVWP